MHDKFVFGVLGFAALVGFATQREPTPQNEAVRIVPSETASKSTNVTGNGLATTIPRAGDGHFYVTANVNGQPVRFMIDTGASMIALTRADAEMIGLQVDENQFSVIGRGASGDVMGRTLTLDSVEIDNKRASNVSAAIIAEGLDISLLGQSYLSQLGQVRIEDDQLELR